VVRAKEENEDVEQDVKVKEVEIQKAQAVRVQRGEKTYLVKLQAFTSLLRGEFLFRAILTQLDSFYMRPRPTMSVSFRWAFH